VTNELMIFGRPMKLLERGSTAFDAVVGIFRLQVRTHHSGWEAVCFSVYDSTQKGEFGSREAARDWLESEARRIMRECLYIAGPNMAKFEAPDVAYVPPGVAASIVTFGEFVIGEKTK